MQEFWYNRDMQENSSPDRLRYLPAIFILAGLLVIILIVLLVVARTPGLSISEIMLENDTFYPGNEGSFPDWIELHNPMSKTIRLGGMYLSDDQRNLKKWQIPDIGIGPHEYRILESGSTGPENFPFGLSTGDNHVILSNKNGKIIQSVSLKKTRRNHSLIWTGARWTESEHPSPAFPNTEKGFSMYIDSISTDEYPLRINEFCPVNKSSVADESGDHPDWIEIYNYGDKEINLQGLGLSDSKDNLFRWQFPSVTIKAGAYLVVFSSGRNVSGNSGWLHTNFRLNGNSDNIILSAPKGMIIDQVDIEDFPVEAESAGIINGQLMYFSSGTAGRANVSGLSNCTDTVSFSQKPGFYDGPLSVELDSAGEPIRFTIDGSDPTAKSDLYSAPVNVKNNTVIKARVFRPESLPGPISTGSFFISETAGLPVVSVSLDNALLYSESKGLMVKGNNYSKGFPYLGSNFWQEWEYPASIEFFGNDKQQAFSVRAGLKIFGAFSRALPQKSFQVKMRNTYGMSRLNYKLFDEKEIYSFESFVLRSGGQDARRTKLRDLISGKLAGMLDLEYQAGFPVMLYLNGDFYGICNVREKIDDAFLAANTGRPDKHGFDLIQGNNQVREGTLSAWQDLTGFASSHDLSGKENYEKIKKQVDINDLIDYHILQIYIANSDGGNIRFWRGHSPGDKWRWIVFDTDLAFFYPDRNAIREWLNPAGRGHNNMFSTVLITRLLKNREFRDLFIKRFIYRLKYTLTSEKVADLIIKQATLIQADMPRQTAKWGTLDNSTWNQMVNALVAFAKVRSTVVLDHLKGYFRISDSAFKEYLAQ